MQSEHFRMCFGAIGVLRKVFGPEGQGFIQGWIKFYKEQRRECYCLHYSGLPMEEDELGQEHDTFRSRREMLKGFW